MKRVGTYLGVGVLAAACLLAGGYVSKMLAETPAAPATAPAPAAPATAPAPAAPATAPTPAAPAPEPTPAASASECPLFLDYGVGIKGEIVGVQYVDEIAGVRGNRIKLNDEQKKKMRLALVTLKITKPAGKRLTMAAADITLHYNHADQTEVAPCEGLSSFSSTNDGDRPMDLSQSMGPGFVKTTSGAKCTAADTIYVDAVFAFMEADTKEVWICIGQPLSRKPFVTQGWK